MEDFRREEQEAQPGRKTANKAEKFAKRSVETIVAPYEADSKLAMWMGSLQKTQISLSSGCNESYLTSIWMLKNCCCLKEKISQKSNPTTPGISQRSAMKVR